MTQNRPLKFVLTGSMLATVQMSGAVQDTNGPDRPPARDTDRAPQGRQDRQRGAQQDQLQIPASVQFVPDVVYATAPADDGSTIELLMDVAFLKEAGEHALPAIVYIHGGGYQGGSKENGRGQTIAAAAGGYVGVTINYRLAGAAKYPAAVHDCKAAIRFLRANAAELGIDANRIGVWGHSAGGHLSALLATSGNAKEMGDADSPSTVTCAISISGPSDFVRMLDTPQRHTIENWFGEAAIEDESILRSASPMTHLDADDPPLMIVHGTDDSIVPFDQAMLLRDAAHEAGITMEFVRVNDTGHSIDDPRSLRRMAAFFDEHLGGSFVETIAPRRRGRHSSRVRD